MGVFGNNFMLNIFFLSEFSVPAIDFYLFLGIEMLFVSLF